MATLRWLGLCMGLALVFPSVALASVREVVQESTGSAESQEQAVAEALMDAVRQVNGAKLQNVTYLKKSLTLIVGRRGDWLLNSTETPVHRVESETQGLISKYQLLSMVKSGKLYKARVRAFVPKYQSDVADQGQRRLAILPFRIQDSGFALREFGSQDEFVDQLADQIGVEIGDQGRFSLVDRAYIAEMAGENAFLNWDSPPEELARLGQKIGADFILVGRVHQARTVASNSYYGTQAASAQQIRLNWKLIEAATSKIVASDQVNTAQKDQRQALVDHNGDLLAPTLLDTVSKKISQGIMKDLYPSYAPVRTQAVVSQPIELTPGSSEKPFSWE